MAGIHEIEQQQVQVLALDRRLDRRHLVAALDLLGNGQKPLRMRVLVGFVQLGPGSRVRLTVGEGLEQEFDLTMREQSQQEQRREIARGARQQIVLELAQDLAVRPTEALGELVGALPIAPLERCRLHEPAGVVHK